MASAAEQLVSNLDFRLFSKQKSSKNVFGLRWELLLFIVLELIFLCLVLIWV